MTIAVLLTAAATYRLLGQDAVWVGPYYSGAANFDPRQPFRWVVCPAELVLYREVPRSEQVDFRFGACADSIPYTYNSIGFMWAVYGATVILPTLSPHRAMVALQLGIHTASILMVLCILGDRLRQVAFLALYGLNPLILYFVLFPYEYFWTSLASLLYLVVIFRRSPGMTALIAFLICAWFLFHVRATTLPLTLLALLVLLVRTRRPRYFVAVVTLIVATTGTSYADKSIWHTAYIGVGAYPNNYVQDLSDNNGYTLFEKTHGVRLNVSSPAGNYYDPRVYAEYSRTLKAELLSIAQNAPLMLLRNATLNTLQSYSLGYPVGHPRLGYLSAGLGLLMMLCLLRSKQRLLFLGVGAVAIAFTPYFPPIPAYVFGAYMLLAVGAAEFFRYVVPARHHCRRS